MMEPGAVRRPHDPLAGLEYRVTGLEPFTATEGSYRLTVDASAADPADTSAQGVQDFAVTVG
jgi:hypothetical protein